MCQTRKSSLKSSLRLALPTALCLGILPAAHASLNVDNGFNGGSPPYTVDNGGGLTTFDFSASIAANDVISSGDFFRIYDFGGYVPGSAVAPAGWTASVANSNPTPPPNVILSYGDDPTIPNLIFTYTGPGSLNGPLTINGFTAQTSSYTGTFVLKDFASQVHSVSGGNVAGIGAIAVAPRAVAVPEPSTLAPFALAGAGLLGLGLRARKRSKAA